MKVKVDLFDRISIMALCIGCFCVLPAFGISSTYILIVYMLLVVSLIIFSPKLLLSKQNLFLLLPFFVIMSWRFEWSHGDSLMYVVCYLLGMLFVLLPIKSDSNRGIKILLFFATVVAVSVLLQVIFPEFFTQSFGILLKKTDTWYYSRSVGMGIRYGIAADKVFSDLLGIIAIGIVFFKAKEGRISKKTAYILIVLMLFMCIMAGSRSNLFIIPIALIIPEYIVTHDRKKVFFVFKIFLFAIIGFIFFILAAKIFPDNYFFSRVINSVELFMSGQDVSSGRDKLFNVAFEGFKSHPILGNGWFAYLRNNVGIIDAGVESHVHCIILELLYDVGIIGTILFLTPFMYNIYQTYKRIKYQRNSKGGQIFEFQYSMYLQLILLSNSILHIGILNGIILQLYFMSIIFLKIGCEKQKIMSTYFS